MVSLIGASKKGVPKTVLLISPYLKDGYKTVKLIKKDWRLAITYIALKQPIGISLIAIAIAKGKSVALDTIYLINHLSN